MIELRNEYDLLKIVDNDNIVTKKGKNSFKCSDNIYTFDIEVSSLFNINGKWQRFNYDINDYTDIEKASCVYISMFGVNDNIYYFRNFSLFNKLLQFIASKEQRKIIYIHNLGYEFQFLREFFNKYTVERMLASAPHKPISFFIKELNIEFRCSYRLTNLSLEKAAEKYTNIKKLSGSLDYEKERSPLTKLSDKELLYCEYDIKTLYEIIKYFRNEYYHVYNIPYTQTGEVRRDLKKRLNYLYFQDQKNYVPDYEMYLYLMQAFQGGITHANMIWSNKVLKQVHGTDEASAYPTMMLTKKYPCGKWFKYDYEDYKMMHNFKCFLFHIKIYNIKSKLFNHYLSTYKCIDKKGIYSDNGRIVKADYIEIIITDCDFEMLNISYEYDKIKYVNIYGCNKKYLDKRILQYILDLYKQKTELKGIKGQEDFYMKSKQRINSLFGCACTNPLNQDTYYSNGQWGRYCTDTIKDEFIQSKLEELKNGTNYFNYAVGVWITAYNRKTLWAEIAKNDLYTVYYDTDSIKSIKEIDCTEYNNKIINECIESANNNNLNINDFAPCDIKGVKHQIGIFEPDAEIALEFKTLGAKKYCYRYKDGLHMTVSGVRKNAVTVLNNDINNFKADTIFDYQSAKKNIHFYTEQTPFTFTDIDGNTYKCINKYGIVLEPTTYTLGITEEYENILKEYGGLHYEQ